MRTLSLALFGLTACSAPSETLRTISYDHNDFSRFDLRMDAGNVVIEPGLSGTVEATLQWRGDRAPELESRLAGGTLLVALRCPFRARDCGGDLQVVIPAYTEVNVLNHEGTVSLSRFEGPLDVRVGEGAVTLDEVTGQARVEVEQGTIDLLAPTARFVATTVTGDIRGTDLDVPIAEARSQRGAVDLTFATPPDLADITTASGDIEVSLPSGEYDVDAASRRGSVDLEGITNTSNASSVILARSTGGDIRVVGR